MFFSGEILERAIGHVPPYRMFGGRNPLRSLANFVGLALLVLKKHASSARQHRA
jgi:hypothetical protein